MHDPYRIHVRQTVDDVLSPPLVLASPFLRNTSTAVKGSVVGFRAIPDAPVPVPATQIQPFFSQNQRSAA